VYDKRDDWFTQAGNISNFYDYAIGYIDCGGVLSLVGFFNPGVSNYESYERKMVWRARWERLTCPFRGGTWEPWPGFCVITYKDGVKYAGIRMSVR